MATFTGISDHRLLSGDARALDAEDLTAHVDAAEIKLALTADVVPAAEMPNARLIVVEQVNWQVAFADEGYFLDRKVTGPISRNYRDWSLIAPAAALLLERLIPLLTSTPTPEPATDPAAGWGILTSLR